MKLEGVPPEESVYTQDELNRLFQNPSMSLCYKYSFYSNIVLTTFFYMSLFPLGTVFSFAGLLISYFLEIVHLGFYKRPEILNSRLCKCFVYNFKVAMAAFAIGNYIFLNKVDKHRDINWSLINLIVFIVIVFIPYSSIKFNLLGIKEGEITKGSYDEYELMFATDYEKQNPLTKKEAMIRYFEKLRSHNMINQIQYENLINRVKKESTIVNYYKISKSVGNILNYYEFQNQFAKVKKKYNYIKQMKNRNKNKEISTYDIFIKEKAKERREYLAMMNSMNKSNNKELKTPNSNINNIINNNDNQLNKNNLDENSKLSFKNNLKVKGLVEDNPKLRRKKISVYMKETLIEDLKGQGIYSLTDEESDDESIISGVNSNEVSEYDN
jgi:hypothetical protein